MSEPTARSVHITAEGLRNYTAVPARPQPTRVAALGGGHGLYGSLSALRLVTSALTAVVTVADDGGSSGRLRQDFAVVPPGDLRMALSALCDDTDWGRTWRDVLQHRFASATEQSSRALDQHALGNLLIVSLWQLLGDTVAGLDWVASLLNARGRVLPMACEPLVIEGNSITYDADGSRQVQQLQGQCKLAKAQLVEQVRLLPAQAQATPEAVAAIMEADWVILGPGSWYTSVLPHLLLPGIRDALLKTEAKICVVMNLQLEDTETKGMSAAEHLQILQKYVPEFKLNAVIADRDGMGSHTELEKVAENMGAAVTWAQVRDSINVNVHDPLKLGAAYEEVFRKFR